MTPTADEQTIGPHRASYGTTGRLQLIAGFAPLSPQSHMRAARVGNGLFTTPPLRLYLR